MSALLETYAKCLMEVLCQRLRPSVTKFSGVMWHGTALEQAQAAQESQTWRQNPCWAMTWIGPAAYGFLDEFPQPHCDQSIPERAEDCGTGWQDGGFQGRERILRPARDSSEGGCGLRAIDGSGLGG